MRCGLRLVLVAVYVWAVTAGWRLERTPAQREMVCVICLGTVGMGGVWVIARACYVHRLLVWWAWRVQCCGAACLVQLGAICVVWCGSVLSGVLLGARAAALGAYLARCAVACGRWCGAGVLVEGCVRV